VEVPAGLVDAGESPEECAIRELYEETGYHGEVVKAEDAGERSCLMFNDPG
jgi:ADP-ribose pyrophosphatase